MTNGDFETGDFTGWTITPAASESLFGVVPGNGVGASYGASFGATAGLHDSFSQTLATTPGASYTLSFFGANVGGNGPDSLQVLWDGAFVFNETPVASLPISTFPAIFQHLSFPVVASGPSTVLEFRGFDGADGIFIDNVSVMTVDANGSVPEPSSLLAWGTLVLAGSAAVVVRRRRR